MTIDLKWGLPFVMPFAVLITLRLLVWASGADWSMPDVAVAFSAGIGGLIGLVFASEMQRKKMHWNITIGGRGNG